MDDLHRRLLRWAGRDRAMCALRDLVRYGHALSERERGLVERALTDTGRPPGFAAEEARDGDEDVVKLQPSEFEVIEAGVYLAVVDSVTAEDPNPRFEDSRPQLKFIFEITEGDYQASKVFAWTGQTFGSKSKLRPWLSVLLPGFNPDRDELDTDDLVEKPCRIVVSIKAGEDGKQRNRVTEVLPLETRRRGQAVGVPAVVVEPARQPVGAGAVPTVAQRRSTTEPTLDETPPF